MLYLLINKEKQAPWQTEYERFYIVELRKAKYPFKILKDYSKELTPKDFLWVMHYKDLDSDYVKRTKAKIISQVNGTSANPYIYQIDRKKEIKQYKSIIDIALVFNERVRGEFQRYFNTHTILTGFPVTVPKMRKVKKQNKIVIGGRISPDKQFYLATYLLKDLTKKYEIVFCMGAGEKEQLKQYGQKKFEDMGFKFKFLNRRNWLKELNTAKYVFSCSLGDIMSVSIVEGILLGCMPIVPKFEYGLPAYDSYINFGYAPFSKIAVEASIEYPPLSVQFDQALINPTICCQKLIVGLNQYDEKSKEPRL